MGQTGLSMSGLALGVFGVNKLAGAIGLLRFDVELFTMLMPRFYILIFSTM